MFVCGVKQQAGLHSGYSYKGMRLRTKSLNATAWHPSNFFYLNTTAGSVGSVILYYCTEKIIKKTLSKLFLKCTLHSPGCLTEHHNLPVNPGQSLNSLPPSKHTLVHIIRDSQWKRQLMAISYLPRSAVFSLNSTLSSVIIRLLGHQKYPVLLDRRD